VQNRTEVPSLLPVAKGAAQAVPATMKRHDSAWIPVLMYEDAVGEVRTGGFHSEHFTDDNIEATLRYIHASLKKAGAVQAVLILPIWAAPYDEKQPDVRARERQDRQEQVLVVHVDRKGTQAEVAKVLRSTTDKPRLEEWRTFDGLDIGGAVADILRSAIG
jgi:hypothetical protein